MVNITIIEEEEILIMIETIDPTIELEGGLEMVLEEMIKMIIDQTVEGTILGRTKGIEGEDISQDCGTSRQRFRNNSRDSSRNRNQYSDRSQSRSRDRRQRSELLQEKERVDPGQIQDLDQVPVLALIETDLGAIHAADMIIL